MRLRMTMAALALALIGAGEASAETLYAAADASQAAEECTAAAPCTLFTARRWPTRGHAGARARPLRRRGQRDLRRPRDAARACAATGRCSTSRRCSCPPARRCATSPCAARPTACWSCAGPPSASRPPTASPGRRRSARSTARWPTAPATRPARPPRSRATARCGTSPRSARGTALAATGATTAVNSILAGATDARGAVTLEQLAHRRPRPALPAARGRRPAAALRRADDRRRGAPALADELDLSGGPRTAGAAPDQGALEYRPLAPVVTTGAAVPTAGGATVIGTIAGTGARYHVQYGPDAGYGSADRRGRGHGRGPGRAERPQAADHLPLPLRGGQRRRRDGRRRPHVHDARRAGRHADTDGHPGRDRDARPDAVVPAATATPTPPPAATPHPSRRPKPKVTITLPTNKRCRPTRSYSVRAKIAKGGTITSVEVYVNKRRKLRVTGAKALKAIRVSGLPRGRYTLEVRVKTRDGRTERLKRGYRTCTR